MLAGTASAVGLCAYIVKLNGSFMSYRDHSQNQPRPDTTVPTLIVLGALVVVGAFAALSKSIADGLGADFWVVLDAMGRTVMGLLFFGGLVIGAAYLGVFPRLGCAVGLLLSVAGSVVWWCFGTVLDSMALGGLNPASATAFHYGEAPWWDTWWIQWGGSALLLGFVIACAVRALDDG